MGMHGYTSDDRLDRLALHLALTTRLLECGTVGVALKDQLSNLGTVLREVIADDAVKPGGIVLRSVGITDQSAEMVHPFQSMPIPG